MRVVGLKRRLQQPHLRPLVRAQGEGQQFDDQAGGGGEQTENLGHRKAAARLLPLGLAEGLLQGGGVGRDGAGAVHQHRPQAAPARRCGRAAHDLGRVAQQCLQHRQRQAQAGPAVRGRFHRGLGQEAQVRHGSVEAEYLQQQHVNGANRPAAALAPLMTGFDARLANGLVGEEGAQIELDSVERAGDTGHPWLPEFWRPRSARRGK